jgi:hypothetical protein
MALLQYASLQVYQLQGDQNASLKTNFYLEAVISRVLRFLS